MSATLCFFCSIGWILIHLLLLSVDSGTSLPTFLDGQWATFYTNTVVQPIDALLNSSTFSAIATVVLWGLLGLLVYTLLDVIIILIREERRAEQNLQSGGHILRHPMRHAYIVTVLWRASILLLTSALAVVILAIPQSLLQGDTELIAGRLDVMTGLRQLGVAVIAWALLFHGGVVFMRLFLLRPRLFGHEHIAAM